MEVEFCCPICLKSLFVLAWPILAHSDGDMYSMVLFASSLAGNWWGKFYEQTTPARLVVFENKKQKKDVISHFYFETTHPPKL